MKNFTYLSYKLLAYHRPNIKQETAEDVMAGLQSKFQNLNAKVKQNVDRQTDDGTDGHHQSLRWNCFAIRPKMLWLIYHIIACILQISDPSKSPLLQTLLSCLSPALASRSYWSADFSVSFCYMTLLREASNTAITSSNRSCRVSETYRILAVNWF